MKISPIDNYLIFWYNKSKQEKFIQKIKDFDIKNNKRIIEITSILELKRSLKYFLYTNKSIFIRDLDIKELIEDNDTTLIDTLYTSIVRSRVLWNRLSVSIDDSSKIEGLDVIKQDRIYQYTNLFLANMTINNIDEVYT